MTDIFNALFELGASVFLGLDLQALRKDRRVAGISVISRIFFVAWGFFNPYFYAAQGLMWSFWAGIVVCGVNLAWLGTYYKIKWEDKKAKDEFLAWQKWEMEGGDNDKKPCGHKHMCLCDVNVILNNLKD